MSAMDNVTFTDANMAQLAANRPQAQAPYLPQVSGQNVCGIATLHMGPVRTAEDKHGFKEGPVANGLRVCKA